MNFPLARQAFQMARKIKRTCREPFTAWDLSRHLKRSQTFEKKSTVELLARMYPVLVWVLWFSQRALSGFLFVAWRTQSIQIIIHEIYIYFIFSAFVEEQESKGAIYPFLSFFVFKSFSSAMFCYFSEAFYVLNTLTFLPINYVII